MGINKVILVGNVGKDPETRHLENGTPVCNFTMATSETYKDKAGQKVTQTEWHNIVMWRQLAEIADKWVKKGSQIYLEGKIRTRSYDDKDGNKRYVTEIVADTMQLLGSRPTDGQAPAQGGQAPAQAQPSSYSQPQAQPVDDFGSVDLANDGDDLPF
jgi:single-strand DNA-binding protein